MTDATIKLEYTWKGAEFLENLRRKAIPAGLNAAAEVLADTYTRQFGRGHGGRPSAPGQPPNSQTGHLRNSIGMVKATAENQTAFVGTNVMYGRYLDRGAVIRPKNGKAIVIPLNAEAQRLLTRYGGSARKAIDTLKSDRSRPIHFAKSANGLVVLRSRPGRNRGTPNMDAMYLLTSKAVIQARPWILPGLNAAKGAMQEAFAGAAAKALTEGGGQ